MMESPKAGRVGQLGVAGLEANVFEEVFSNSLVWTKIVEHLSFGDMKASSQVCRLFLQMVRETRRFKETAMLVVCSLNEELFQESNVMEGGIWRSLQMDVTLPSEVVDVLQPFLEPVESLTFVPKASSTGMYGYDDDDESKTLFIRVLSSVPNLKHLQIGWGCGLQKESGLSEVLTLPEVQKNLQKLKNLDILKWQWNETLREYKIGSSTHWPYGPKYGVMEMVKLKLFWNLEQLPRIPKALQSFKLGNMVGEGAEHFFQFVQDIVDQQKETLEELSVHLDAWKSEALGAATFPVLKSLSVVVNPEEQSTLAQFLRNHLTLEELDVGVYRKFSRELFDVIRECSVNLRKLCLRGKSFDGELDWSFLGFMKRLKEFQLVKPYMRGAALAGIPRGPEILAALPKNQLECLTLKGLSALDPGDFRAANNSIGFWRREGEAEIQLDEKKELLRGFTNLKKLKLVRCHNCIDDGLMQFILEEFKSLEELKVSHCWNLTNAGLTGDITGGLGTGVSLARLTGLKSFCVRACPQVTLEGLRPCLILPNLKSFDYLNRETVPESLVQEIVAQHPSLETLTLLLSSHSPSLLGLEGNNRFRKLLNQNREWIEDDSDSDADDTLDDQEDYDYEDFYDEDRLFNYESTSTSESDEHDHHESDSSD